MGEQRRDTTTLTGQFNELVRRELFNESSRGIEQRSGIIHPTIQKQTTTEQSAEAGPWGWKWTCGNVRGWLAQISGQGGVKEQVFHVVSDDVYQIQGGVPSC
jgi:hypothetical protein